VHVDERASNHVRRGRTYRCKDSIDNSKSTCPCIATKTTEVRSPTEAGPALGANPLPAHPTTVSGLQNSPLASLKRLAAATRPSFHHSALLPTGRPAIHDLSSRSLVHRCYPGH